jgi:hypothetical protein
MCDANDYAIRAVVGKTKDKKHHAIAYAIKTLTGAQLNMQPLKKSSWLLRLQSISLDLTWLVQRLLFLQIMLL